MIYAKIENPEQEKRLMDELKVPLPTYSPHLNLIERLWHYIRDNMTRSYFHVKLTEQCEAIVEWLETLPMIFCLMNR